MKRILIINTVPFGMGGMSSVIVNYIRNMNKSDLEITMIVNSRIEKTYRDILEENGISLIVLKRNYNLIKYIYQLYNIMKKEKFDVVHIHGNSSTMVFELLPAYLIRIPKRIAHCHNVSCEHIILNKLLKPIFKRTYNIAFACSKQAGEWLFGNEENIVILNNAINLEKYKYNEGIRNKIRNELNINDYYVIGHVGYFNEQKNHEKLFEIINYLKEKINIKLICVSGNSEVPYHIKDMIKKYDLKNNIEILLRRNDVNEILQGMDCFVFPSKFEGLGLALVEAEATGINCVISDKVPKAAAVCRELVEYCNLEEKSSLWGKVILKIKESTFEARDIRCENAINNLKMSGYDICVEAEKLRKIYIM